VKSAKVYILTAPHIDLNLTSLSPRLTASLPYCLTGAETGTGRRERQAPATAELVCFELRERAICSAPLFFSSSFAYIRLPLLASHRFPGFCGWPIEPPRLAFDRDLRVRPQSLFLGIPRVSRAFTQPRLCLNPKTFSLPSRDPPGLWSSQILRRSLTDLHRTPPTARQPTCRRRWKSLDQDRL
jgi:hypothetical protein